MFTGTIANIIGEVLTPLHELVIQDRRMIYEAELVIPAKGVTEGGAKVVKWKRDSWFVPGLTDTIVAGAGFT